MPTDDEKLMYVEQIIERTRARWRGVVPDDQLQRHLAFTRDMLLIHPVAQEYVARAMPRKAPEQTEERGSVDDNGGEKAVGHKG